MLGRLLCVLAFAGCFQARTAAERPRKITYNALTVIGGVAMFVLGFEVAKHSYDADGIAAPDEFLVGMGACIGGGYLTMAGIGGLIGNAFYTPP